MQKSINLTHLCFVDDLMVFVDGQRLSVEGIIKVFDEFTGASRLEIIIEKTKINLTRCLDQTREDPTVIFPFKFGHLPVKYLGLPFLTKRMKKPDYEPLVERRKSKMGAWTGCYLSFAGRFQLLTLVILSIVNFWIALYRLPYQFP